MKPSSYFDGVQQDELNEVSRQFAGVALCPPFWGQQAELAGVSQHFSDDAL